MHETNNKNIIGFIDSKIIIGNNINLRGWSLLKEDFSPLKLRVISENDIITQPFLIKREDVFNFYSQINPPNLNCGWQFEAPLPCKLEAIYNSEWVTIFDFQKYKFSISPYKPPSYIVADNFYQDPDSVRDFALSQNFISHIKYHKGKRTEECFLFDGIKERFEKLIGRKIINWGKYGTNGCFQS